MIELLSVNKYFVITSPIFTKRAKKIKETAREVKKYTREVKPKVRIYVTFREGRSHSSTGESTVST